MNMQLLEYVEIHKVVNIQFLPHWCIGLCLKLCKVESIFNFIIIIVLLNQHNYSISTFEFKFAVLVQYQLSEINRYRWNIEIVGNKRISILNMPYIHTYTYIFVFLYTLSCNARICVIGRKYWYRSLSTQYIAADITISPMPWIYSNLPLSHAWKKKQ